MKRLTSLLFFCVLTLCAVAQTPGSQGPESWSQMWNTANVYYNPSRANLGSQLDTLAASASINLVTSRVVAGVANADTFIAAPLSGYGKVTIFVNALKGGTGTDTVTFRSIGSNDGVVWDTVSLSKAVLYPTSLTVPVGAILSYDKVWRYLGVSATASSGSGNIAVWSSYYLNKLVYITSK